MEALAKASHNPDEIVLGEDDEDEEQEIEGSKVPSYKDMLQKWVTFFIFRSAVRAESSAD